MKLKKLAKILLSCVLAGALFTGCGGGQGGGDKPAQDSGKDVQLGMLTHLNTNETKMDELYNSLVEKSGIKNAKKFTPKFYENLRTMQLAVESGDVQEISLYKCVAEYLVATNDKFEIVPNDALNKIQDLFCFAVRKEDTQLKADLDKVIDEMKSDGTLDKLISEYITNVDKKQAPPKIEIPTTDGAPKIKVGVTGDLPPLDYVNADGSAAGFNTALLAEVAKRLGRNIELVQIETGSRASALTSNFIDVVFWAVVPFGNDIFPADIDKPEGLDLSAPYFKDSVAHIKLKSDK